MNKSRGMDLLDPSRVSMRRDISMASLAIVMTCMGVVVAYGIVHDLFTAHLCVEYFSVGHPDLFGTNSPLLLALGWGVVATWWMGLLLGIPLAMVAQVGSAPKRSTRTLLRPIAQLLIFMAACALIFGSMGYWTARDGRISLSDGMAKAIAPERHALFLADAWAHSASYFFGFFGGLIVITRVWLSRINSFQSQAEVKAEIPRKA
jgi:hypothetical protein